MPSYSETKSATAAADNSAVGTVAWSNVNNVFASDDSDATAVLSVTGPEISHYLVATGFNFNIPPNATINGILVSREGVGGIVGAQVGATDNAVRIVKGGSIGSTDKSSGEYPELLDAVNTFGGSSDLWGESWTPADINASNFGVAFSATTVDDDATAAIDHIQITVYYTINRILNKVHFFD